VATLGVTVVTFWFDRLRVGRVKLVTPPRLRVQLLEPAGGEARLVEVEFRSALFVTGRRPRVLTDLVVEMPGRFGFVRLHQPSRVSEHVATPIVLYPGALTSGVFEFRGTADGGQGDSGRSLIVYGKGPRREFRRVGRMVLPNAATIGGHDWIDLEVKIGRAHRIAIWLRHRPEAIRNRRWRNVART
jgi:hypothetical protein